MHLAAFQVKDAAEVGVKAGLTILESSLLGAFAVICLLVAVVGVWLAYHTQNARVSDQQKMADKLEGLIKEQAKFTTGTTEAIERLTTSEQRQAELLQNVLQRQSALQSSMSSILSGLMRGA